jgi:hypothetical protein
MSSAEPTTFTTSLETVSISSDEPSTTNYKKEGIDDKYVAYVRACANLKSPVLIKNNSNFHSQITTANILRTAQKSVAFYTTGFRESIDNDTYGFLAELEGACKRGIEVRILVDEKKDSGVFNKVEEFSRKYPNVKLRLTNDEVKLEIKENHTLNGFAKKFKIADPVFHFQIGDKVSYRLEYNNTLKSAIVCFNSPLDAPSLFAIFDEAFDKSTIILPK